jgi:hypothetical protein
MEQVARIDLSLTRRASNRLLPAPSLGSGFEDIAIDYRRAFCLIEAVEDFDGLLRGFVAEYDRACRFLRCTRLHTRFQKANKGFEGLAHAWLGGRPDRDPKARNRWIVTPRVGRPGLALRRTYGMLALQLHRAAA